MSLLARPTFLYSAISRMASMDSRLAGSMKLQVLTTRTSAWSGWGVSSWPLAASRPIMTSLSTRFLGQPKLTKPIFKGVSKSPTGQDRSTGLGGADDRFSSSALAGHRKRWPAPPYSLIPGHCASLVLAGLTAASMSMAAGEYVSVHSQAD